MDGENYNENWIPAFAGMTAPRFNEDKFRGNDNVGGKTFIYFFKHQ